MQRGRKEYGVATRHHAASRNAEAQATRKACAASGTGMARLWVAQRPLGTPRCDRRCFPIGRLLAFWKQPPHSAVVDAARQSVRVALTGAGRAVFHLCRTALLATSFCLSLYRLSFQFGCLRRKCERRPDPCILEANPPVELKTQVRDVSRLSRPTVQLVNLYRILRDDRQGHTGQSCGARMTATPIIRG